jgi:long-chain acyl-CoA synthetase
MAAISQEQTLAAVHRDQAEWLGPRVALRYKRLGLWHDLSWADYRADALACAAALVDAGIEPGDRVGVVAENRIEWLIADLGILAAGAVNVPPHAPLAGRQVHYQLADAGSRWLFLSNRKQIDKIGPFLSELPNLRGVVVFDDQAATARVQSWTGFLQRGRRLVSRYQAELARREADLRPGDLATIMYTSGTTGNPKGVMLTHANLLSNARACQQASPRPPDSLLLSWLPFSHIYARTVDHYSALATGVTLALCESADTVVQDLAELQPTHLSGVPRFYEKVLASVAGADPESTCRRLRRVFGSRIDWLISGGAPLPAAVAEAYQAAGLLLLQGYGLTESSPVISFNRKDAYRFDTVGPPLPGVDVRIAPDGEVLTRGPHVMVGYWNNAPATAEALRDGWLYTGDLGTLEDGFLKITGRKKELVVLSNGKKVVPNHIEGLLVAEECIEQAVVYGEGRPFLTALLVPNWETVRRLLATSEPNHVSANGQCLAEHPAVQTLLRQRIRTALAEVAPWEKVKRFAVLPQPFSVETDEMTVSLKVRRGVVIAKYGHLVESFYRE